MRNEEVTIINSTKAVTVGTQIEIADTSLSRLIGLAGRRRLNAGCGLLIQPSSGIHTIGMRFAIDVVALNRELQVVKLWHRLSPWRIPSVSLKTKCVLELPAGAISMCRIEVGDRLAIVQEPDLSQEHDGASALSYDPSPTPGLV